jgi:hypothetical protein
LIVDRASIIAITLLILFSALLGLMFQVFEIDPALFWGRA